MVTRSAAEQAAAILVRADAIKADKELYEAARDEIERRGMAQEFNSRGETIRRAGTTNVVVGG